jgi:hypothetical protein
MALAVAVSLPGTLGGGEWQWLGGSVAGSGLMAVWLAVAWVAVVAVVLLHAIRVVFDLNTDTSLKSITKTSHTHTHCLTAILPHTATLLTHTATHCHTTDTHCHTLPLPLPLPPAAPPAAIASSAIRPMATWSEF